MCIHTGLRNSSYETAISYERSTSDKDDAYSTRTQHAAPAASSAQGDQCTVESDGPGVQHGPGDAAVDRMQGGAATAEVQEETCDDVIDEGRTSGEKVKEETVDDVIDEGRTSDEHVAEYNRALTPSLAQYGAKLAAAGFEPELAATLTLGACVRPCIPAS